MLPGSLVLLWFEGWGLLIQLLFASTAFCGTDAFVQRLRRRSTGAARLWLLGDDTGLVSAVLLTLALPSYAPWWVTVCSAVFASLFGKALFGGAGRNPFNPAMLGYAFALLAFPSAMLSWPASALGLLPSLNVILDIETGLPDGWSQATVLEVIKHNQRFTVDELFATHPALGLIGGRAAEWANLAFLAGGLWLLRQRVIGWHAPAGFLAALFVLSMLCWNGSGSASNGSPLLHLFSGGTMLAAFFIVTEPISGARTPRGRLFFGIGVGLLTYAIRAWGGYPDGIAFAVLLMNLCVTRLDHYGAPRCRARS